MDYLTPKIKKPHVFVLPAQACFCNRAAWCNDISYFSCPFVTVAFLSGVIAQKKARTGNLMPCSLFLSVILRLSCFLILHESGFLPFRLCSPCLQRKSRNVCVWQMPGSCSGILRPGTGASLRSSCRMGSAQWAGRGTPNSNPSLCAQPALQPWRETRQGGKAFCCEFL